LGDRTFEAPFLAGGGISLHYSMEREGSHRERGGFLSLRRGGVERKKETALLTSNLCVGEKKLFIGGGESCRKGAKSPIYAEPGRDNSRELWNNIWHLSLGETLDF